MGGFGDLFDIFGHGGGPRGGKKQQRKVRPTQKEVQVSLEDIYTGKLIKLDHKKTILCEDCKGKGGEDVQSCKECGGRGQIMKMQQIGPGMYSQSQVSCAKCKGTGEVGARNSRSWIRRRPAKSARAKSCRMWKSRSTSPWSRELLTTS